MARFATMALLLILPPPGTLTPATPDDAAAAAQVQAEFEAYSGAKLVFEAEDLPRGRYHDRMPALPEGRRPAAARIALREVKKLPPGFLGGVGLRAVGVFEACVSEHGDGFRPYDDRLKGYRYYGIWNGADAIAAAYYGDEQLPLTLHHEIFHHVDATDAGRTEAGADLSRDERFRAALSGKDPYPALEVPRERLAALQEAGRGRVLEGAVSDYCAKSPGEDKAETARYLMSNLPDALVQMATRPELPGSQRLLHVIHKYRQALPDGGATVEWFTSVALGRRPSRPAAEPPAAPGEAPPARELAARLRVFLAGGGAGPEGGRDVKARDLLRQVESLSDGPAAGDEGEELLRLSVQLAHRLIVDGIEPADGDRSFKVRGREDENGVNWTLRNQVADFAEDVSRLGRIAALAPEDSGRVVTAQVQELGLVARYYRFIARKWQVTAGTRSAFRQARDAIVASLEPKQARLARRLGAMELEALAEAISDAGTLTLQDEPAPHAGSAEPDNPYLRKVDAAIADPALRAAIRAVQPACVAVSRGSGVNISPDGEIVTAAHVAGRLHARLTVDFPDGRTYTGECTAIDTRLDLAILSLAADDQLPCAPLAKEPPDVGTRVVCIGQPGAVSPAGRPTGYQPFTVSLGSIRGLVGDPLGDESLGRTEHDAWTYWGHSGSPLFNEKGAIVALHNSWDPSTGMRRAVTHQAIVQFLTNHHIRYSQGD